MTRTIADNCIVNLLEEDDDNTLVPLVGAGEAHRGHASIMMTEDDQQPHISLLLFRHQSQSLVGKASVIPW